MCRAASLEVHSFTCAFCLFTFNVQSRKEEKSPKDFFCFFFFFFVVLFFYYFLFFRKPRLGRVSNRLKREEEWLDAVCYVQDDEERVRWVPESLGREQARGTDSVVFRHLLARVERTGKVRVEFEEKRETYWDKNPIYLTNDIFSSPVSAPRQIVTIFTICSLARFKLLKSLFFLSLPLARSALGVFLLHSPV